MASSNPTSSELSPRAGFLLSAASGILLGLSFPPSPFYSLAYVAFIPFLLVFDRSRSYLSVTGHGYIFLTLFHVTTVYWAGGFTHMHDPWMMSAGAALLFIHPLLYLPFILLASLVRRKMGLHAGLAAFIFLWISYEYIHSVGEFTFPWMTVGTGQAYDVTRIQIAEYTSAYGLTFLICLFNAGAYLLLLNVSTTRWQPRSWQALTALAFIVIVYAAPWVYGRVILSTRVVPQGSHVRVGVVQPNFDPWEKWGVKNFDRIASYKREVDSCMSLSKELSGQTPDIILWPETAIPFDILLPQFAPEFYALTRSVDSLDVPIFTGLEHVEIEDSAHASVTAQRVGTTNYFYESYNAATIINPGLGAGPVYEKMVLVPFAERIPYASAFRFLIQPLKWNVGISNWGIGHDTLVYSLKLRNGKSVRFGGMICYESVYPDFVRQFTRRGAQFFVVLTNDSWWGKTSGGYQHAAYASLRAVENRRWIVQCANGGISEFVDPYGLVHSSSPFFEGARWVDSVATQDSQTFYTKHGDVFAQGCLCCSAGIVILAFAMPGRRNQK